MAGPFDAILQKLNDNSDNFKKCGIKISQKIIENEKKLKQFKSNEAWVRELSKQTNVEKNTVNFCLIYLANLGSVLESERGQDLLKRISEGNEKELKQAAELTCRYLWAPGKILAGRGLFIRSTGIHTKGAGAYIRVMECVVPKEESIALEELRSKLILQEKKDPKAIGRLIIDLIREGCLKAHY